MEYSRLDEYSVDEKRVEYENKCDKEIALIRILFPKAKFTISIDYDELDKVISREQSIIAIQRYDCYCYNKNKQVTEYYHIKGKNITNRYAIQCLIEQGFEPKCKHSFLEGFTKMKNSSFKYEINMGS